MPGVTKIPLASRSASARSRPTVTSNTSNWARAVTPFAWVPLSLTAGHPEQSGHKQHGRSSTDPRPALRQVGDELDGGDAREKAVRGCLRRHEGIEPREPDRGPAVGLRDH